MVPATLTVPVPVTGRMPVTGPMAVTRPVPPTGPVSTAEMSPTVATGVAVAVSVPAAEARGEWRATGGRRDPAGSAMVAVPVAMVVGMARRRPAVAMGVTRRLRDTVGAGAGMSGVACVPGWPVARVVRLRALPMTGTPRHRCGTGPAVARRGPVLAVGHRLGRGR